MSREDPQLRIRLPIELKEKIQNLAEKNNRSMNAEIVTALEMALSVYDNSDIEAINNPHNNPKAIASMAGMLKTLPRNELATFIENLATISATQAANKILSELNKK
ncbi:Arc family DNA-binding protein [Orbus sturtevantii]